MMSFSSKYPSVSNPFNISLMHVEMVLSIFVVLEIFIDGLDLFRDLRFFLLRETDEADIHSCIGSRHQHPLDVHSRRK